jgi:HlyD family secretion protein
MTLRAPVAGTISLVPVWRQETQAVFKAGDHAWPGAPIAELPETSSLRISARVDESERGRLAVNQAVTVHLDAIPDRRFTGRIEEIGTIASEDYSAGWPIPRDFDLRITLDQLDPRLRLGMTAQITIIADRIADVLIVPVQVTFQKTGETFAYVWEGSKFRQQRVEISRRRGDRVVIAKGLQAGDRVALEDPTAKE